MDFILLKLVNFFFALFLEDLRKTEKWSINPYKWNYSKRETQKWKLDPVDSDCMLMSLLLSSFLLPINTMKLSFKVISNAGLGKICSQFGILLVMILFKVYTADFTFLLETLFWMTSAKTHPPSSFLFTSLVVLYLFHPLTHPV